MSILIELKSLTKQIIILKVLLKKLMLKNLFQDKIYPLYTVLQVEFMPESFHY